MKSDNLRCSMFVQFFGLSSACTKHNSCLPLTEELTNRNVLVNKFIHKQKTVNDCGPSNIYLGIFVCYNHPLLFNMF